jgi:hypothetical protein
VKPKKLRFYKVNSVGPETYDQWGAYPSHDVCYEITKDSDRFTWFASENGTHFRSGGRKISTKADAIAVCQKRWDAFVAKQVKAMMEKA